ncbi:MAG: ATP-binding cassette domain-containing protein [Elusimicrobiaceae bacterium]|jgi:ABC-2 type transport system ATP-binding protein
MIKAENFIKRYGPVTAVAGISFETGKNTITGFLGPNGAGKTTTLKAFTGFIAPTQGTLTVAGMDVTEAPLETKRLIGYLPENNPLYEDMETADYLLYNGAVRGLKGGELRHAVKNAVANCGLGGAVGKQIGALSKGYRQRIGLANAILHNPPVLFLDEPTTGLDPNQAEEARALIRNLGSEKTILFSTHILDEARRICDELIIINKGKIAAQGKTKHILNNGEFRFSLTLAQTDDIDEKKAALLSIPGARDCAVKTENGQTEFTLTAQDTDLRPDIFRKAAENRWKAVELKRETSSLEEIFRNLTQ